VCGPITPNTPTQNRYFVTYLDEGSRYLTVKCTTTKSQAAKSLLQHIDYVHHHTPTVHAEYYTKNNINIRRTIPHSPQENSLSERINRTIMDTARATLNPSKLPHHLWDYAVMAAVDTYNHTPHKSTGQLPVTIYTTQEPNIQTLQAFGALGHVHQPQHLTKLQPRARIAQYIGRPTNTHYYVYYPDAHKVARCRATDFRLYSLQQDPVAKYYAPIANNLSTTTP